MPPARPLDIVCKLDMTNLDSLASSPVNGAAETIEEIESEGWAMSQMAVYADLQHWSLVMLFRRLPVAPVPQG